MERSYRTPENTPKRPSINHAISLGTQNSSKSKFSRDFGRPPDGGRHFLGTLGRHCGIFPFLDILFFPGRFAAYSLTIHIFRSLMNIFALMIHSRSYKNSVSSSNLKESRPICALSTINFVTSSMTYLALFSVVMEVPIYAKW